MRRSFPTLISIHVLREEDDIKRIWLDFFAIISIHVLREEDDLGRANMQMSIASISIHVLREEDDV